VEQDLLQLLGGDPVAERAAEVLKRAQEIDQQESGMFPFIREFKSLSKAIAKFKRI